jgi:hypothetical protein
MDLNPRFFLKVNGPKKSYAQVFLLAIVQREGGDCTCFRPASLVDADRGIKICRRLQGREGHGGQGNHATWTQKVT